MKKRTEEKQEEEMNKALFRHGENMPTPQRNVNMTLLTAFVVAQQHQRASGGLLPDKT